MIISLHRIKLLHNGDSDSFLGYFRTSHSVGLRLLLRFHYDNTWKFGIRQRQLDILALKNTVDWLIARPLGLQ